MHQNPMIYPRRTQNNCNTFLGVIVALTSLGVSVYIAHINRINLGYNARNAYASEKIARELYKINGSGIIEKLCNEVDNQNTKQSNH